MGEIGLESYKGTELRKDRAVRLFRSGFNCCQSVFTAYADLYGIEENLALRFSASFGAGIGRMREVCGCASAIFMIAGLETGCTNGPDQQGKAYNYEVVQHLAEEYKKKSGGSMICRELLGLDKKALKDASVDNDPTNPTPSKRTEDYYKKRPCIQLIQDACEIIEHELINRSDDKTGGKIDE